MRCKRWFSFTCLVLFLAILAATAHGAAAEQSVTSKTQSGKLVVTFMALQTHGTATLVQTPSGKAYLVDTGNAGKEYDSGRDTIGPLLRARGIKELAGMALSHPHADHTRGAVWLLDNFPVKLLVDSGYEGRGQTGAYRAIRSQAQQHGAKYAVVHAGDRLDWDPALQVEVLSPPKEFVNLHADPAKVSEHSVLNNNSIVLRIQHGDIVVLLPGDVYGSEGSYMLKNWPKEKLRADVLAAPHHGYNETPGYAAVIRPKVVVASCLVHTEEPAAESPANKAREIFGAVGAKVYVTGLDGQVQVTSDGRTIQVTTEHQPASRE